MKLGSLLLILVLFDIILPFIPQSEAIYEDYSINADFSEGTYYQCYYYNGSLQNLFWADIGTWKSECYNLTDFYVYGWETIWLEVGTLEGILWIKYDEGDWIPLSINPLNATVNTAMNGAWDFYFEFELNDGESNLVLYQFTLFIYANHFVPTFINSLSFYIIIIILGILGILTLIYLKKERYI